MVQTKKTPCHEEVQPLKCVVYISQNQVRFVIQCHHELFLKDQRVHEKKYSDNYERHVHCPPKKHSTATLPKETLNSRHHEAATLYSSW